MDLNELLIKAATYGYPEEIPVMIGILPSMMIRNGTEMKKLMLNYPHFFGDFWQSYDPKRDMPVSYREGSFTDAWGCVWENKTDGMESIVTGHPLPNRDDIKKMKIPVTDEGLPHGFMYLRLLDLRGFEETMFDFAEEPPALQELIDNVLQYNIRQTKLILSNNKSRIIYFGDDLGMQNGLAIGAEKWRKYLKPCFAAIFKLCKDEGRIVYMHTDGCIHEIMPDLAECGADIINPQYRANGLDNLVCVCKHKIPIALDLDRQLFPFASPARLREHIRECVEALYLPEGGLALSVELCHDIPMENIAAILDALTEYKGYRGV